MWGWLYGRATFSKQTFGIHNSKEIESYKINKFSFRSFKSAFFHNIINEEKGIKDMSKEKGQCDKNCDKCSMEIPKKKNIFNELAIDNINRSSSILRYGPFEKDFYLKHSLNVSYLGHPLLDEVNKFKILNDKVIAERNR